MPFDILNNSSSLSQWNEIPPESYDGAEPSSSSSPSSPSKDEDGGTDESIEYLPVPGGDGRI
jgi:hypothetical protein